MKIKLKLIFIVLLAAILSLGSLSCDSVDTDLLPISNSTYDVGSEELLWAEGWFDSLYAPTGRSATFVVAASDSSSQFKAQADYLCDGTADNVQIQAANDAADGGTILLANGTYNVNSVTVDNCKLDAPNATINVTGTIQVNAGGKIGDINIEVATGYTGTPLIFGGDGEILARIPDLFGNIYLKAVDLDGGTGVLFQGIGNTGHGYIALSHGNSIVTQGFEYPVKFYAEEDGYEGFLNGLTINSIICSQGKYLVTFEAIGTAQVVGNEIACIQMQPDGAVTTDGITFINSGENKICAAFGWDWGKALGAAVRADASSYNNIISTGRLDVISDLGYQNEFVQPIGRQNKTLTVPTSGWTGYSTGSGGATGQPFYNVVYTGTTANSDYRYRCDLVGLNNNAPWMNCFNSPIIFRFSLLREVSDSEAVIRIQISNKTTEGQLTAQGIGFQIENFNIKCESYGSARTETDTGITMVNQRAKDFMIAVYPGNIVMFYVDGALVAIHTGTSVPVANVSGAILLHTIANGATGGTTTYSYLSAIEIEQILY